MSETSVDESADVAAGFAALMSEAAEQASPPEEAPHGYTRDEVTGELRPKKAAGRPRKSPSLDELKAAKEAEAAAGGTNVPPAAKAEDRVPSARRPHRRKAPAGGEDKPKAPIPQFREGQIERGINGLYRKAGRLIRVMDADVGQALIDITRKEDAEDQTVGECWEQLARTNPRIRAFLLRMIAGGAWGQLFMCHAPVLMAIVMKDAIRKRLPFGKVVQAFLEPDEDGDAPADGTAAEGLTMPDMEQMMAAARQFAEQAMGRGAPAGPRVPVAPDGSAPDPPPPVA